MTDSLILASGEMISREEILEGLLLLASSEAPFPMLGEKDAHLAVLLLVPEILEFNADRRVI